MGMQCPKWFSMSAPGRVSMPSAPHGGCVHHPSDITGEKLLDALLPDKAKETTNPSVSQSLWMNMELINLQESWEWAEGSLVCTAGGSFPPPFQLHR